MIFTFELYEHGRFVGTKTIEAQSQLLATVDLDYELEEEGRSHLEYDLLEIDERVGDDEEEQIALYAQEEARWHREMEREVDEAIGRDRIDSQLGMDEVEDDLADLEESIKVGRQLVNDAVGKACHQAFPRELVRHRLWKVDASGPIIQQRK